MTTREQMNKMRSDNRKKNGNPSLEDEFEPIYEKCGGPYWWSLSEDERKMFIQGYMAAKEGK